MFTTYSREAQMYDAYDAPKPTPVPMPDDWRRVDWWQLRFTIAGRLGEFCGTRGADDVMTDFLAVCDLLACDPAELVATMTRHGVSAAMFVEQVGEMVQGAPAFGYLAPAPISPNVGTRTYKQADGTVRGRSDRSVIGHNDAGDYVRMFAPDALALADMYLHAAGSPLPLIGTDDYSWAEVITHDPYRYTLTADDGTTRLVVERPEGAGDSLVGQGRKRRSNSRTTRVTYEARPISMSYDPSWPFSTVRVVKTYRTRRSGYWCDGHGAWQGTRATVRAAASSTSTRVPRVPFPKLGATADSLPAVVHSWCVSTFGKGDARVKILTTDGVTVAITHRADKRAWRVVVTTGPTGETVQHGTTVRTVAAATAYVTRHT